MVRFPYIMTKNANPTVFKDHPVLEQIKSDQKAQPKNKRQLLDSFLSFQWNQFKKGAQFH